MTTNRFRDRARRWFRGERGATDPILVIAAIAVSLVLLVGGSFAVAGMIANGKNLNAQGDLDKIATAEASAQASANTYLNWAITTAGVVTGTSDAQNGNVTLDKESVGFTTTANEEIKVVANGNAWVAGVVSQTGTIYWRSSLSATTYKGTITASQYDSSLTLPTLP
ncbi:hypothetical protein [Curtobacterium sp. MCBD17_040]|uniref:TadE/TadG family type IV pilus assembly protein n=1 Tax=Curtobacterium sp. MCBD17_040 TaxID=2175674 RepID=UPI000DA9CDCB|nr:hypothetical protein [Curtobacterium sp. MCBD17_040]WIB65631.1 hypothetical protein DEI94_16050 [Curtobacterium sp. MCBD17_040]